jgi:hypothetical protein
VLKKSLDMEMPSEIHEESKYSM